MLETRSGNAGKEKEIRGIVGNRGKLKEIKDNMKTLGRRIESTRGIVGKMKD